LKKGRGSGLQHCAEASNKPNLRMIWDKKIKSRNISEFRRGRLPLKAVIREKKEKAKRQGGKRMGFSKKNIETKIHVKKIGNGGTK